MDKIELIKEEKKEPILNELRKSLEDNNLILPFNLLNLPFNPFNPFNLFNLSFNLPSNLPFNSFNHPKPIKKSQKKEELEEQTIVQLPKFFNMTDSQFKTAKIELLEKINKKFLEQEKLSSKDDQEFNEKCDKFCEKHNVSSAQKKLLYYTFLDIIASFKITEEETRK